jgi:hypothetical protein
MCSNENKISHGSGRRKLNEVLFLFNGDFGRFNYRKNGIALFEIHSLD